MAHPDNLSQEERVLVLAPTVGDATLTEVLLAEAGLKGRICSSLVDLCQEFDQGVGVILLTEEVLAVGEPIHLVETLRHQSEWSDVPILLLAGSGTDSLAAAWALDLLGNVTVLERPVRVTTLVSALRAALRARRRQYELRGRMQRLRTQGERLRLLWETAAVLLTTERPDAMMRGLFAKIAPHLDLDAYFNYMIDESADALRMESCQGIPDEEARKIQRLGFGQAICGAVAMSRQPVVANRIHQSDDPRAQLVKAYGIRAYVCNPLLAGDRLLGTLSFASRRRDHYDTDEQEFLQTVCHYVAYAYDRLRLIRQLREEDEKKDEFLATLAHELRNPLAPIRNAAQYLRLKGGTDPDLQNAREIIDRQVRHMTRLVDDLLDISRITRGKIVLQRERTSVALILTNSIESSRPLIDEAGHTLSVTVPPEPLFVDGDVARLGQVFGNLLTNAAKYTDREGRIEVSVERQGSDVVIRVKDNGIGIAAEHLPRLFDMFSQVDPALDRTQGGLGIGLALVKSLVEMHGGRVEAHSHGLGLGSMFTVRLPLLVEMSRTGHPESRAEWKESGLSAQTRCQIVVADDNVDSALSLAMMLTVMGHEARAAHDGLEAVQLAEAFRPDVILLDIGMPRMNGYEAARHIRDQPWGKQVLLIALTGWGQPEDKRRAEDAGFDQHFTKPVEPAVLVELLKGRGRAVRR